MKVARIEWDGERLRGDESWWLGLGSGITRGVEVIQDSPDTPSTPPATRYRGTLVMAFLAKNVKSSVMRGRRDQTRKEVL